MAAMIPAGAGPDQERRDTDRARNPMNQNDRRALTGAAVVVGAA
jgi:hypothetical protein